jgi:HD superfamily phosphohydrolase
MASLISEKSEGKKIESVVPTGRKAPTFLNHMSVGREILTHDTQIQKIFKENDIDTELIYSIFTRDNAPKFSNVISSDLDADRIDYLLRSASNTGLPYGSVDINYLVSQMRVDKNNKFCITPKALRTADHFLLCRYFEYSQVIHHKTVAAFEMILKEVIFELLGNEDGRIDCSCESIINYIENGFWNHFDDSFILQEIRNLRKNPKTPATIQEKAKSILERNPPKEIFKIEYISERSEAEKSRFKSDIQRINTIIPRLAEKFKIDCQFWRVWDSRIELTKVGLSVEYNKVLKKAKDDEDKYDQTVNVLNRVTGESTHIMEIDNSLMHVLADKSLFTIRLYILFPSTIDPDEQQKIKDGVFEEIKKEMPYFNWK